MAHAHTHTLLSHIHTHAQESCIISLSVMVSYVVLYHYIPMMFPLYSRMISPPLLVKFFVWFLGHVKFSRKLFAASGSSLPCRKRFCPTSRGRGLLPAAGYGRLQETHSPDFAGFIRFIHPALPGTFTRALAQGAKDCANWVITP